MVAELGDQVQCIHFEIAQVFYVLILLVSVNVNSACENFHNVDRDLGGGTTSFYEKDISPNIGWSIDRCTKVQIIYKYLFIRISDIYFDIHN